MREPHAVADLVDQRDVTEAALLQPIRVPAGPGTVEDAVPIQAGIVCSVQRDRAATDAPVAERTGNVATLDHEEVGLRRISDDVERYVRHSLEVCERLLCSEQLGRIPSRSSTGLVIVRVAQPALCEIDVNGRRRCVVPGDRAERRASRLRIAALIHNK